MTQQEDFEKMYAKKRTEFFKKYFENQELLSAIYNIIRENLLQFTRVHTKFLLTYDCIKIIIEDKNFYSQYDNKIQEEINILLKGLKVINKDVEKILKEICKGLE